ncbi:hypothetical protein FNV43_RR12999 [Rhamnella rubrinervis]|uniref:Uncharacterized protein n=1 Tax=Rhamnella rubrinervis TaxID=2594499 RepID=A0A8K0MEJ5_9ROSA|nr:hypothetical protein FNV43_RR12999 [Rhamnella rubrinervis]
MEVVESEKWFSPRRNSDEEVELLHAFEAKEEGKRGSASGREGRERIWEERMSGPTTRAMETRKLMVVVEKKRDWGCTLDGHGEKGEEFGWQWGGEGPGCPSQYPALLGIFKPRPRPNP